MRKTALVAGVIYLITLSDSDPPLDGPVRNDPNYVQGPGPDDPILIVAILEVIVALACVGTAVVLYSVVKRQHEEIAMGFVGSRVLEAATIFVGVVTLLSVVPLRQAAVGADALATSQALVAVNNWTFVLGRSFLPVVNALLLGSLFISLPPGASDHSARGADWSAAAFRFRSRRVVRPLATGVCADGDRRPPDRAVGVLAGRLAGRKTLQALTHHRWKDSRRPPARR
jgi:hypothetical protein